MQKIIGHQAIIERFRKSITRKRLASTFLFVGPASVGKKTFALELAKSLLCESVDNADLGYCNHCESCSLFDSSNHPDFHFVQKPKDKAFLQIEQFIGDRDHRNRAGLCHDISLSPFRGGHKIAVIDDADFFNQESANCLLKTLEEPPPRSILIMVGTSEHKQLSTIRSRSQVIHFRPLNASQISQILKSLDTSDIPLTDEQISQLSDGSLNVIQQVREEGLLEFRDRFLGKLASLNPMNDGFSREVAGFIDQAGREPASRRKRIRQLADFAIQFYSQVARASVDPQVKGPPSLETLVSQTVSKWKPNPETVTDCIERCLDVHLQVAANANQTTLVESWMSDLGKLSRGEEDYSQIKANLAY